MLIAVKCILCYQLAFSQGLDSVVVEKYYASDSADVAAGGNLLEPGSVTYRVFIYMKPGYRLQAIYGSEMHPLTLSSRKKIYNHPNYGNYIPNLIPDYSLPYNTVMLDSWISMGAACMNGIGVPKFYDDTVGTIKNRFKPPVLQNSDFYYSRPVNLWDGIIFIPGKPPLITVLGLDSLLGNLNKVCSGNDTDGYYFKTNNGAWACLEGARNDYSKYNVLLVGQFTTAGEFRFEFNMQLGSPDGKVERYVHSNPTSSEIHFPALMYSSETE